MQMRKCSRVVDSVNKCRNNGRQRQLKRSLLAAPQGAGGSSAGWTAAGAVSAAQGLVWRRLCVETAFTRCGMASEESKDMTASEDTPRPAQAWRTFSIASAVELKRLTVARKDLPANWDEALRLLPDPQGRRDFGE
jgi:hypothetical protein